MISGKTDSIADADKFYLRKLALSAFTVIIHENCRAKSLVKLVGQIGRQIMGILTDKV